MTAVVDTGFIIALLVIARLMAVCRGLFKERLHTDPLTGLPNRLGFEAIAAAHLKAGRPFTVVWIGLDGLRRINELCGYASGDEILVLIASRIRRHLRPGDAVARFGGDQFLVLLRGNDPATGIIARILAAMEASAGVSIYPNHADNVPELLELAETAMRNAKVRARGTALVHQASVAANDFRGTAVADLIRSALANDHFRLVYQPIVDISCEIVRMEAFVRLEDPLLGRLAPPAFIGVAEQTGLIHEMGACILRQACRQAREWHEAGFRLLVSIKMSPLQLASEPMADDMLRIIAESGLQPSAIAFEITGAIGSKRPVERLRSAGIRISTQHWFDANRGEANPLFDGIRVKAPFKLPANKPNHLMIIAQGIEEPEQLDEAHAAGCNLFQGYQIAPPLEPEDATEILRTGLFAGAGKLVGG
jgi:diguanylate cyclase (GGDEF)-like protein